MFTCLCLDSVSLSMICFISLFISSSFVETETNYKSWHSRHSYHLLLFAVHLVLNLPNFFIGEFQFIAFFLQISFELSFHFPLNILSFYQPCFWCLEFPPNAQKLFRVSLQWIFMKDRITSSSILKDSIWECKALMSSFASMSLIFKSSDSLREYESLFLRILPDGAPLIASQWIAWMQSTFVHNVKFPPLQWTRRNQSLTLRFLLDFRTSSSSSSLDWRLSSSLWIFTETSSLSSVRARTETRDS